MIRDPSDGSVREIPKVQAGDILGVTDSVPASGLREPSQKPAMQARLEQSREWLKSYFERKGLPNG